MSGRGRSRSYQELDQTKGRLKNKLVLTLVLLVRQVSESCVR